MISQDELDLRAEFADRHAVYDLACHELKERFSTAVADAEEPFRKEADELRRAREQAIAGLRGRPVRLRAEEEPKIRDEFAAKVRSVEFRMRREADRVRADFALDSLRLWREFDEYSKIWRRRVDKITQGNQE